MRIAPLSAVLLLAPLACLAEEATVIVDARITTMDPARPRAEAMAFDASGKILSLGTSSQIVQRYPGAKRIALDGAPVVPGLIDAHGHVLGLGLALMRADLVGTASKQEIIERLQTFAKTLPKDAWLLGRGWDQNDWPEKAFPTAADLDRAFPERPVWLERIDGHAGWANSAAIAKAKKKLDGDWQPNGGRIERKGGKATGVLVDNAMSLIDDAAPPPSAELATRALGLAFGAAVAHGLTGVHDAGVPLQEFELYRKLAEAGSIPLRIYAMADGEGAALDWLCKNGKYRDPKGHLEFRTVKMYADGALGSRGAALLEDYADDPGNKGLLVTQPDAYEKTVRKAKGCGVQVATHAIGDRGNRMVLDTYEKVLGDDAKGDHRWRVEHAQVLSLADIPRFAKLGVIASMQPTHATSDMPWAEARVGPERIVGAYAWRSLRDSGARLAFGSDFPVESVNPMFGLYSAATRTDPAHKPDGGWLPEQKVTAYEALRGFTLDAAYAGFAEKELGSLEPGKRADFVVLRNDLLGIPPEQLHEQQVVATYVDGKEVYRRPHE